MKIINTNNHVCIYMGEELGRYAFGKGHPFGPKRMEAFWAEVVRLGLDKNVIVSNI